MKKVIIIGCPGSGKTSFAEKLNKFTGLPLYYLDAIWHKPDKTHIPREEFDERIAEIFAEPEWIIDGNYGRTLEIRLQHLVNVAPNRPSSLGYQVVSRSIFLHELQIAMS